MTPVRAFISLSQIWQVVIDDLFNPSVDSDVMRVAHILLPLSDVEDARRDVLRLRDEGIAVDDLLTVPSVIEHKTESDDDDRETDTSCSNFKEFHDGDKHIICNEISIRQAVYNLQASRMWITT